MAKAKGVLLILVNAEKTFKEVPGCKTALYNCILFGRKLAERYVQIPAILAHKIVNKIPFFYPFCLDPGVEDRMSVIWEKGVVSYTMI